MGKFVTPSDVLFETIDPNSIHVVFQVFGKDINKLQIGQKVLVYTNSNPKKYICKIILLNKDWHRIEVLKCIVISKTIKDLVPGMYMNVEIQHNNYKTYV